MTTALLLKIGAESSALRGELAKANGMVNQFTGQVSKMGGLIAGAFTATAILNFTKTSIKTLSDFEYSLSTVRAITGATGDDFESLKKNALDLGSSTEYTATQVAGLQAEFGRLGFTTNEILNSTKATLDLATATGSDLARSAEIAGSTLRGFGLDAIEMGRVVDVMASSFNKSALNLNYFAEGVKYVAPVARSVNSTIEETAALMSVLADAGIKGSMSGTALRRIFSELSKDGRPLSERLQELADKGINLAGAQDEVGAYAKTALLVLTSQVDKINELTIAYGNAAGQGEKTAAIMRDNLTGDVKILESAWDGAILKGEGFIKVLRGITQFATTAISILSNSPLVKTGEDFKRAEKAIAGYKLLYEEALSSGNRAKAMEYAKIIAQLASGFGFVKDKAVELNEGTTVITKQAKTITSLTAELSELNKKYVETDIQDTDRLRGLKIEITTLEEKIKKLRELGSVQKYEDPLDSIRRKKFLAPIDTKLKGSALDQLVNPEVFKKGMDGIQAVVVEKVPVIIGTLLDMSNEVQNAMAGMAMGFGTAIGDMLTGVGGIEQIAASVVGGFGAMATQLGQTMIQFGFAGLALKKFVKNPAAAIAAGIALVAIGRALSNKAQSIAGGGGRGGSGGGSSSPERAGALTKIQYGNRVQVTGSFELQNDKLVAAIRNEQKRQERTLPTRK